MTDKTNQEDQQSLLDAPETGSTRHDEDEQDKKDEIALKALKKLNKGHKGKKGKEEAPPPTTEETVDEGPVSPVLLSAAPTHSTPQEQEVEVEEEISAAKTKSIKDYSSDTFEKLDGIEAVRLRPGMYVGDSSTSGLHRLVFEAVDNSIDEALAGVCKNIHVTIHADNSITVIDDGRGIPVDMNKRYNKSGVELALTELHSGTKFSKKVYSVSGGLHGVGISVVNMLSEWMKAEICRDGFIHRMEFKRGLATTKLEVMGKTTHTGTMVCFKPDREIFDTTVYDYDIIAGRLKELAYLSPGVKIKITDERKDVTEVFKFDGGLEAFISDLNKNKGLLHTKIIHFKKEYDTEFIRKGIDGKIAERTMAKIFIECAMQFTDAISELIFSFANNINTFDGGTHVSGLKTGLTRTINAYAKDHSLLKNETAPTGEDIRSGLTGIVSVKLPNPQFRSQSKNELRNPEVQGFVEMAVNEALGTFMEENPTISRTIVENSLAAARGRIAAKKARELAKRKGILASGSLPGKLADCSNHDTDTTELYLVEGDSAGGSAKQGRDRNFQAILPLRGKILNVEKARLHKMLQHEEITTIISALGTGIGAEDFNIEKLRYGKIIIMTDADVDGSHIRTLLLTFFFRHMLPLIEGSRIYVAQPPLYLVKRKNKKEYVYDDRAMQRTLLTLGQDGINLSINDAEIPDDVCKTLLDTLDKIEELGRFVQKRGVPFQKYLEMLDANNRLPMYMTRFEGKTQFFLDDQARATFMRAYEATHVVSDQLDLLNMQPETVAVESGPRISEIVEQNELETLIKKLDEMNLNIGVRDFFGLRNHETRLTLTQDNGDERDVTSLQMLLDIVRQNGGKGIEITRYKGLGEMNAEQLWETTMDPATRLMRRVAIEDRIKAEQMFTTLMGEEVAPRREFIETHALDIVNLDV